MLSAKEGTVPSGGGCGQKENGSSTYRQANDLSLESAGTHGVSTAEEGLLCDSCDSSDSRGQWLGAILKENLLF